MNLHDVASPDRELPQQGYQDQLVDALTRMMIRYDYTVTQDGLVETWGSGIDNRMVTITKVPPTHFHYECTGDGHTKSGTKRYYLSALLRAQAFLEQIND